MNKNDRERNEMMHQMEEQEAPKVSVVTSSTRTEINNLQEQIVKLNRIISLYEDDPAYSGYYALVRLYNEQVECLRENTLKELIAKEGKEYDRVMKIADTLADRLIAVNKLKNELNPTDDENADVKGKLARRKIISPESMSNVLTNPAGKNS